MAQQGTALFLMNADGSNQRQITHLGGANFGPSWTPDGKKIVFSSNYKNPRSGNFVGLVNFAETPETVSTGSFGHLGYLETALSSDGPLEVREGRAHLPALGFVWMVER